MKTKLHILYDSTATGARRWSGIYNDNNKDTNDNNNNNKNNNNNDYSFLQDNNNINNKIGGILAIGCFIITWITSVLSPFIFVFAFIQKLYTIQLLLIIITIVSYLPWKRGTICDYIRSFFMEPHYQLYKSTRILCEDPPLHGMLSLSSNVKVDNNNNNNHNNNKNTIIEQEKQESSSTTTATPNSNNSTDNNNNNNDNNNQQKPTFFAIHPHGAFCLGWSCLFVHPIMETVKFCFSPILYASPLFRLLARIVGNPHSANKISMMRLMKASSLQQQQLQQQQHQVDIALPPGGFEEATLTDIQQDRIYIKKRTGFIKLCLQYNYQIRPVYCFGEKNTFSNIQGLWDIRLLLNRYGIPTILIWGLSYLPFLPRYDFDFTIIIGKPIILPHIINPTKEQVILFHQQYIKSLNELYETYKEMSYGSTMGGKDRKLEVW